MQLLVMVPTFTQREKNYIGITLNGSGFSFTMCSTYEEFWNIIQKDKKILLIISECEAEVILPHLSSNTIAIILAKSPLNMLAKNVIQSNAFSSLVPMQRANIDFCELSVALQKHVHECVFGLQQHMHGGVHIHTHNVRTDDDRQEIIKIMSNFILNLGSANKGNRFAIYSQRIIGGLDELLLNAVFDANPRLRSERRDSGFSLYDNENVRVCWGFDGVTFGFSVEDSFGLLNKKTAINHLSKVIRTDEVVKGASGGMGLQLTYQNMHKFVCNVQTGKRTEILCFLKFLSSFKDCEAKLKTFHFFTAE